MSEKSLFVDVRIDQELCVGFEKCGKCVKMCTVKIFAAEGDTVQTVQSRTDECTLCDICLDECPHDAITIEKLY